MAIRKQKITVPFTKGQSAGANSLLENEKLQQMTNCYIDNSVAQGGVKQVEAQANISPDTNSSSYKYGKSLNRLEGQLVLESDTGFHKVDPKAGTVSTISTDVRARASVVSSIGGISTLNSFDVSENGVFRCVIYSNGLNTPITDASNLYVALYENNLLVYTAAIQEGTKICGAKVLPNGTSDFAIFFYRDNGTNKRVVVRKLTSSTRTLGAETVLATPYVTSGNALFDVVAETYDTVRYGMTVRTTSATEVTFYALSSTFSVLASRVFTTTGSVYGMSLGVGGDLDNKLAFFCYYGDESALGVLRCALTRYEPTTFAVPSDIAVSIVTYISRIAALSGFNGAGIVYYESQASGLDECRYTRIYCATMDSLGGVGSYDQIVLAGYFLSTAKISGNGIDILLEVLNVSTAQYVSGGAYSKLDFQATNLVLLGSYTSTSFKVLARFEPRIGLNPSRVYPHLTSNFIISSSGSNADASFQVRMLRQIPIELSLTQAGTTNAPPSVDQFKSGSTLQVVELDVRS